MKITRLKFLALAAAALCGVTVLPAQEQKKKKARPSPPATVSADIDGNEVKIAYSRPSANNRAIWGGLVPYGKVWRTGANEATLLTAAKPIVIGGHALAAGTYSIFTVPQADGSAKLVINKKTGQWGIPYNEGAEKANELARIDLKAGKPAANVDPFTMAVERTGAGAGVIKLAWADKEFSVAFANAK